MRVLYLPVVSARNMQAAPSYNWFRAVRRIMLEVDPQIVFYVVVPRVDEDNRWQGGAEWLGPRTHVVEVTQSESQFIELGLVTREIFERFNERFGDLHFDAILSEKPMLSSTLKQLTEFHILQKTRGTTLVNRDQFTQAAEVQNVSPDVEVLQAIGWWSAPTVFQSPHQRRRALTVARRHLTPSQVLRVMDKSLVYPLGIDCDEVDAVNMAERDQKPTDRVLVNYSAKLFGQNKFVETLKIMDSVFSGGRPVELQVVTGSAASKLKMVKDAKPYAYITTYGGAGRTEFLRQAAKAHVFITNSPYEDFSATICELLYTGLLPVMPAADWARYLLPEGYPLLFDSMTEGQMMLRYAVDNVEDLRAQWVPAIQEKVRTEFDLAVVVPQMFGWISAAVRDRWAGIKAATPPLVELVEKAFTALPEEFGLDDFYAAVKEHGDGVDPNKDAESMSTSRWMLVDVLLREHPELVDLGGEQRTWRKA